MNQKTKQIIIAVVVIVVAFVGFQMFFGNSSSTDSALATDSGNNPSADGQAVLLLLNRLNRVTLDTSVLTSAVFNSLVSFEQPIPDQNKLRPNPFAPIGNDGSGSSVISTSTNRAPSTVRAR